MKPEVFITGSRGFVGSYLIGQWKQRYGIIPFQRELKIEISSPYTIHLAGIAHDVKNTNAAHLYREVNVELTKKVFDAFLQSATSEFFVFLSSIKAVADTSWNGVKETDFPQPAGVYGTSKLEAEQYILSKPIPKGKRIYVLRPALIHGPGNKGNLALLQKFVNKGIPWPFADFDNVRSYCSIQNLAFVIEHLMANNQISSGVYHIADDYGISTNKLIELMAKAKGRKARYLPIPQKLVLGMAKFGDKFSLPLNSDKLQKLTSSFVVCNEKIKNAIGKPLPLSCEQGFLLNLK